MPSRGIALPPWVPPTAWTNVINGAAIVYSSMLAHKLCGFPLARDHAILTPWPGKGLSKAVFSFVLGSQLQGFGFLSYPFSMYYFLTCLGY